MRARPLPQKRGSRPSVSVVIPNYNYGRFLPTAVNSALHQDGVAVEVIIVDDCSTDGSQEIARAHASSDPRVTLIAHERNLRHIATYNDGLARASGKYVVVLSADDALAPGSLERACSVMEADPTIGLVYGHAQRFLSEHPPADPDPVSWPGAEPTWTKWSGQHWLRLVCRRGYNTLLCPEAVMRTATLHEIGGGWDPEFPHSADMLIWMRAAAHSNVGRVNGRVQAYYRVHGGNMHLTKLGFGLADLEWRISTFHRLFELDGHLVRGSRGMSRIANRQLSREALRELAFLSGAEHSAEVRARVDLATKADPTDRIGLAFYTLLPKSALGRVLDRLESVRCDRIELQKETDLREGIRAGTAVSSSLLWLVGQFLVLSVRKVLKSVRAAALRERTES